MKRIRLNLGIGILAVAAVLAIGAAPTDSQPAPLYGTLGNYSHPISASPAAQRYFDEGLILAYGFNHAEAIRSFQDALSLDPKCAMCAWGIALALGPNINAPMDNAAVAPAYAALQQAISLKPNASAHERAYIDALAVRYTAEPQADRSSLDANYADAMRELSRQYPDDLDAATLFGEALLDLSPWDYWTSDGQPIHATSEVLTTLESVLARNPQHPGANHFYIHATEASRTPQRALPSAQRLETLVPGAGHLVHMAAHTYWRTGRYADAVRINERAIQVDENNFVRGHGDSSTHSFYALLYYPHNIHFVFAGSQMSGRSALALEAAEKLVARIPEDAYAAIPALEDYRPMPLFSMARFGQWSAILSQPRPTDNFQYTTGVWHWARGLAYVRTGDVEAAEREHAELVAIADSPAMRELTLASFPRASTLLTLAGHVLGGELAAARGQTDDAVAELRQAVIVQDGLAYIEPPSWFYPVRQNLGAVLFEAGRLDEAEAEYRADLEQFPSNGWSLFGLARSLEAQGQTDEAAETWQRFEGASRLADVTLSSSRF
jgi:tetratricopeptide (TPR) repeat protein